MCVLRKSLISVWLALDDIIERDMLLLYFKRQSIASVGCSQIMLSEILISEAAAVPNYIVVQAL